jgi:peptidase E
VSAGAAAATSPRRIAAIGGGGFLMDDERLVQERWLLGLARAGRGGLPRVLFVGTAGGDGERGQLKFFRAFSQLPCRPAVLPFFPYDMRRDYRQAVLDADLVYVGGGNTPAMLAVWREFGFPAALREAYEAGTVLAGISAGANCWFERYVTDSVPGGGVRPGLGWLPGCFCPHLDSEPWRQDVLAAQAAPAVGAGDGVVVLYEDERWAAAVTSVAPPRAALPPLWRGEADGSVVRLERLEPAPLPV